MSEIGSHRQDQFIDEFLVDYNGKEAAIRAGFAPKSAKCRASQLLALPYIQDKLAKKQKKITKRLEVSAERVLEELARIAFSNVQDLFDENGGLKLISDMDRDTTAALSGIEVITRLGDPDESGNRHPEQIHKIKLWDKNAALVSLLKKLGMFEKDNSQRPLTVIIQGRDVDVG